jgi:hypothetical protein
MWHYINKIVYMNKLGGHVADRTLQSLRPFYQLHHRELLSNVAWNEKAKENANPSLCLIKYFVMIGGRDSSIPGEVLPVIIT